MPHPNSLENLRPQPWQPGQSGNPEGYSRARRFSDRLMRFIEENGKSDDVLRVWVGAALGDAELLGTNRPDFAFFREMLDRLEGKVVQPIDAGEGSKPGPHTILDDDDEATGEAPPGGAAAVEGPAGPDPPA